MIALDHSMALLLGDATTTINNGLNAACSGGACNNNTDLQRLFGLIANTLIFLVGAVSVIMMILGGLRYVISNGDQKNVTAAKDTIFYAVIGLVVALASYAVVHFVIQFIGTNKK
jgi:cytochrome bd-type quinol oxidase subunit 2